jgi:hypothetical protein
MSILLIPENNSQDCLHKYLTCSQKTKHVKNDKMNKRESIELNC